MNICLQTLEVCANARSAQEPENVIKNEIHTNFLTKAWPCQDPTILYTKRLFIGRKSNTKIHVLTLWGMLQLLLLGELIENQNSDFVMA